MSRNLRSPLLRDPSEESRGSRASTSKGSTSRAPLRSRLPEQHSSPVPSPSPDPVSESPEVKKLASSSWKPHETQFVNDSDDDLWTAECILDERGPPRTGEYLIRWAGNDPATDEPWDPSWEPRSNVTRPLADEWKSKKRDNPSIIGLEGKKLEEKVKAKRAAERAKKRKRDSVSRKPRKKPKNSRSRASASTGAGTPSMAEIGQAAARSSAPVAAQVERADNGVAGLDELRNAVLRIDGEPSSNDMVIPEEQDGSAEARAIGEEEEDFRLSSDIVGYTSQKSTKPARPPNNHSPGHVTETRKADDSGVEVVLRAPTSKDASTKPASKTAGQEKRVRMDSVPITMGADDTAPSTAQASTPVEGNAEAPVESAGDEDEGPINTAEPEGAGALDDDPVAATEPVDEGSANGAPPSPFLRQDHTADTSHLAAIPIADTDRFRSFLPPGQNGSNESSQSTTSIGPSQLDPISQFSSPLRGPISHRKQKDIAQTRTNGATVTHGTETEAGPSRPAPDAASEDVAPGSKAVPSVRTIVVDGEEVLAAGNESGSDSDVTEERSDAPNATREQTNAADVSMEVAASGDTSIEEDMTGTERSTRADSSPDVVIDRTQILYTETITETHQSTYPSPEPEQPVFQAAANDLQLKEAMEERDRMLEKAKEQAAEIEKLRSELEAKEAEIAAPEPEQPVISAAASDQQLKEAMEERERMLESAREQAAEIEKLRSELEAKEAEISRLSTKPAPVDEPAATEVTTPAPTSLHPSRASSPTRSSQALASMRDTLMADNAASPQSVASTNVDQINDGAIAPGISPFSPAVAGPGPSTGRRTANSSTPPVHTTSESAEWALRLARKDGQVKAANKRAQKADSDHESTRQQLAFVQQQYQNASDSAVREVSKAHELEEQVERLRGQLKLGLKQREMITASVKDQHEREIAKFRGQLKLLLDQNRATDDVVRSRAAAYKDLKAENGRLLADLRKAYEKNQQLSSRNDTLLGEIELFRAREMGVVPPVESDSDDSTYATESDEAEPDSPPPIVPARRASQQVRAPASPQPGPVAMSTPPQTSITTTSNTIEIVNDTTEVREGQAYPSPWTPGLFFADEAVSLLAAQSDRG